MPNKENFRCCHGNGLFSTLSFGLSLNCNLTTLWLSEDKNNITMIMFASFLPLHALLYMFMPNISSVLFKFDPVSPFLPSSSFPYTLLSFIYTPPLYFWLSEYIPVLTPLQPPFLNIPLSPSLLTSNIMHSWCFSTSSHTLQQFKK